MMSTTSLSLGLFSSYNMLYSKGPEYGIFTKTLSLLVYRSPGTSLVYGFYPSPLGVSQPRRKGLEPKRVSLGYVPSPGGQP